MGGAVSTGQDNNDLIDNLLDADYIRTPLIERVFRAVDRAEYFIPDARLNAYKDLAWKNGNLHLSAPCIYSEVMEGLDLSPGLSFLNLGCGTGYLSTMVGLILGYNGVNHGVEIHEDVLMYANKKLEDFKKLSGAIDEFDFCEPKFIQGNCLCLTSETRQYDRVYCGAACPEPHENYMKNLLKIGGILVMPLNDQLLQIKRITDRTWDVRSLLPVSFATLIQPSPGQSEMVQLMDIEPPTLQATCRIAIRAIIRKNIDIEYPDLKAVPTTKKAPKKKRALRRLVVPLFDTSDESSDEEPHRRNNRSHRDIGRAHLDNNDTNQNREVSTLIDFVLGRLRDRRNADRQENDAAEAEEASEADGNEEADETAMETNQVQAVIENAGGANENEVLGDADIATAQINAISEIHDVLVDVLNDLRERGSDEEEREEPTVNCVACGTSKQTPANRGTREKFDSGLGDEIIEKESSSGSSDLGNVMELDSSSSSSDDNHEGRPNKRISKLQTEVRNAGKWRRIALTSHRFDSVSSSENEPIQEEMKIVSNEIRTVSSPYTVHLCNIIQKLPLPQVLKNYLNFYREF